MKILITGGCGFVGSNLAIYFKDNKIGSQINSLDNLSRRGSVLNLRRLKKKKIKNFKIDITNNKALSNLPKYDLIVDCCAEPAVETSKKEIDKVFNTNLVGTFNILKKCKRDKSKIIFLSSSRVYSIKKLCELKRNKSPINEKFDTSGPKSVYGFCKYSSEHLIREFSYLYKIKYVITRFGVISGPGQFGKQDQGFVSFWVWKHINKKKLSYIGFGGKGSQIRDVVHILDVCKLISLQIKKFNNIYNVTMNAGGGKKNSISLKNLTKICQKVTSNKMKIYSKKNTSSYDIPYYVTDNSKVKKIYKWDNKKKILHIIQDMYKWMKSNKKTLKKYIK
jgi:CDP-paratose 2-epimerase|tara:strand:- start:1476 stop:2480 length:1005 start_codon:yes stop_codon:yes gene_type:complete